MADRNWLQTAAEGALAGRHQGGGEGDCPDGTGSGQQRDVSAI